MLRFDRLILLFFVLVTPAHAQVSFTSLLDEMVNRDSLAIHPDGKYVQLQASSYNRADSPIGKPANFTNRDWNEWIRTEVNQGRTEKVLLEDFGPGAITRFWATLDNRDAGTLRFYIDGQTTPVFEGDVNSVLGANPVFNSTAGNTYLSFSNPTSNSTRYGDNFYAPIPYASSIKVTYEGPAESPSQGSDRLFYNINYRKFAAGTPVASFSPLRYDAQSNPGGISSLSLSNAAIAYNTPTPSGIIQETATFTGEQLASGQALTWNSTGIGNGAIRQLKVTVTGSDQVAALENTFIELTFDGQRTARVPIGQFFGNGHSESASEVYNVFVDHYRQVNSNGSMESRWVMPYQRNAQVRVVNESSQNVAVELQVDRGEWTWDERSMHFHANYRSEDDIKVRDGANGSSTGVFAGTVDWNYLTVRGMGVYVGDTLSLYNSGGWWGEGDEKVYVDGETFPSHFGTGTEDYYGYAFGSAGRTFNSPFVSQSNRSGNFSSSPGRTVNARVRGADAIPFNSKLQFDMEIWHQNSGEVDFAATTYWYGKPGAVALKMVADLAVDYRSNHDFTTGGFADAAGDGSWTYLASTTSNPWHADANMIPLVFGSVGRLGGTGYGGGQNISSPNPNENLVAISDSMLFVDGTDNFDIAGSLGYHELAFHPGPSGQSPQDYAVARWQAGESSTGLININGAVRNLVDSAGDSVDFYIYVNGELIFSVVGEGNILPETPFNLDYQIEAGQFVDFVIGNGGSSSYAADETWLRATIMAPDTNLANTTLAGDYNADGVVNLADYTTWRDHLGTIAGSLPNDIDGGMIGLAQYQTWKANFGTIANISSIAIAVPEPCGGMWIVTTAAFTLQFQSLVNSRGIASGALWAACSDAVLRGWQARRGERSSRLSQVLP